MARRPRASRGAASDDLTFLIARKYYVEGKTAETVAGEVSLEVTAVRRRIREARDRGMVHILVTPPPSYTELAELRLRVQSRFGLQDVIIVPGAGNVMDQTGDPNNESTLLLCCRAAATYLAYSLPDGATLGVPWGRVASYVAGLLSPDRILPQLVVAPIVGVMGTQVTHPYEANTIAARIASAFGGQSLQLAAPSVVEPSAYVTICELPLVKEVLAKLNNADVVLTPIAAANSETSTIVRMGLAIRDEVQEMIRRGAVGEIASHWYFNEKGRRIQCPNAQPIGLGLEGLYNVTGRGGRVIAVVAASRERIGPLKVALDCGFVNVLITDSASAEELLKR